MTQRTKASLIVGGSAARGPFLTAAAVRAAVGDGHSTAFTQTAWGGDVEYSSGYYLIRTEAIASEWTVPLVAGIDSPLSALAVSVEGRYRLRPGIYAAARIDHLGFSSVTGSAGRETWDAAVRRVEIGGGYSLRRNLLLKVAYQFNRRDTVRVPTVMLAATEVIFWF